MKMMMAVLWIQMKTTAMKEIKLRTYHPLMMAKNAITQSTLTWSQERWKTNKRIKNMKSQSERIESKFIPISCNRRLKGIE